MFAKDREFIDKRVLFCAGNMLYIYATSVDDSFALVSPQWIRAATITSSYRIQREGDKILIVFSQQLDFKTQKGEEEDYEEFVQQIAETANELLLQLKSMRR